MASTFACVSSLARTVVVVVLLLLLLLLNIVLDATPPRRPIGICITRVLTVV
jgi:hypothetical protein